MEHQTKESATSRRASREATPRTGAHPEFGTRLSGVRTVGRGNSDSHTPQVIRSVRLCSLFLVYFLGRSGFDLSPGPRPLMARDRERRARPSADCDLPMGEAAGAGGNRLMLGDLWPSSPLCRPVNSSATREGFQTGPRLVKEKVSWPDR